ncbi:ATP-grasp domain-containing protein [Tautonia sociabilis]|uniref:ATP-grasp domain-containing protein n=1 Tax=Tautonia sociabilis TaxID=2080755 RepID=A0A432MIS1_9BACT|nr:ATP-grasp domain-containing protein [Tautonia sociabilis]RUL87262.1 ATP-grasp domain-containing protein [Tautonia sociabilis]
MTRMGSGGSDGGSGRGRSVLIHEFVTGGGLAGRDLPETLAAEGRAMRDALAGDFAAVPGVRVTMTIDDRLPARPGSWEVVRVGPGQEPDEFARLAAEADYTLVVAPESGGILFDRARILERLGARSLGSRSGAIAGAGNKLMAFDRFRRGGVRTPWTRAVVPEDGWPRRITFPVAELSRVCRFVEGPGPMAGLSPVQGVGLELEHPAVIKPVDGAGSAHTHLLTGLADWPDPGWRPEVAILQPWVEGVPKSLSMIVSPGGRPHVIGVSSQRAAVDRGRISYRGGAAPLPFGEGELRMASRVVRAIPGLMGWVGIDFVDDGRSEPIVLEVNPRPTTSLVAFVSLLGPGTLAGAWLSLLDGSRRSLPEGFFGPIRARIGRPIGFDADGTLDPDQEGIGS